MPKYNCPRCGYNTNDKSRYLNHLKRKNMCDPLINNNDFKEFQNKLIEHSNKINCNTKTKLLISCLNLNKKNFWDVRTCRWMDAGQTGPLK